MRSSIEKNQMWLADISQLATIIQDISLSYPECRDPDDTIYLSAADIAKAEVLVSGDKDLLVLDSYKAVKIITPSEFISVIKQL